VIVSISGASTLLADAGVDLEASAAVAGVGAEETRAGDKDALGPVVFINDTTCSGGTAGERVGAAGESSGAT
jgi:hypothetical protein